MISTKLASIIAIAAFAGGSLFAPPVQEAIAAVIATDVQCTGCVGSSDLAGNAVTSAKIKDGQVKASDLAGNAVTSAKITDGTIAYGDVSRSLIAVEHRDDCNCGGTGWDPDGTSIAEFIYDDRIKYNSVVAITGVGGGVTCWTTIAGYGPEGQAEVICDEAITNGQGINYAIFNNPAYG